MPDSTGVTPATAGVVVVVVAPPTLSAAHTRTRLHGGVAVKNENERKMDIHTKGLHLSQTANDTLKGLLISIYYYT